ncbi:solute carrier family 22 member 12-like [Ixodes scapularis]
MSSNHFLVVMQLLLIAGGRTLDSTAPSPETSGTEADEAACHLGQLDHVIFGFVTSSTQGPSTIRATAYPQAISGHGGNARNMSSNHFLVVMQLLLIAGGRTLDSTAPSPETSGTEADEAACHLGQLDHVIFGFVTSSTQGPSTIRATAYPQAISGHGGNARNMSSNHFLVVMQILASARVEESSLWLACTKGPIRPPKEPCLPRFGADWTVESSLDAAIGASDEMVALSLTIQIFPWSVALKPLVPDAQAILLAAVQVPADCVLMLATAKFPREVVQGSLLLTTGLFSALELLLFREAVLVPRATMAALTSMSTGAASLLLTLSTAELFPTRIRASALGLCRATSEVIRLLQPPYEAPLHSGRPKADADLWDPRPSLALVTVMCLAGAALSRRLPDIRNQLLPCHEFGVGGHPTPSSDGAQFAEPTGHQQQLQLQSRGRSSSEAGRTSFLHTADLPWVHPRSVQHQEITGSI